MIDAAVEQVRSADILVVVGTSLQVYPAAGLIDYAPEGVPIYVIDPNMPSISPQENLHLIEEIGSVGLLKLKEELTTL